MKQTQILVVFILYFLFILLGIVINSFFYYVIITALFLMSSVWIIFDTVSKQSNKTSYDITPKCDTEKIEQIKNSEPKKPKTIYDGEFISDNQFHVMNDERKSWFSKSVKDITDELTKINDMVNEEDDKDITQYAKEKERNTKSE